MGAIVGVISKNNNNYLKGMTNLLSHRGNRSKEIINKDIGVSVRYSKNLEDNYYDNGDISVVDGNIYNYSELNEEFNASNKAELLIKGYKKYKGSFFKKIRGVFSIALWLKDTRTLVLARDPFGVRSLYYTKNTNDDSLLFSSESKAFMVNKNFKKKFNKKALKPFLSFQYAALDETFFEGVYKLPHGSFMQYKDGEINIEKYWKAEFKPNKASLEEHITDIRDIMEKSVERHKVGLGENLGSFLSGGVDSSYIAALLEPKETFSVGFANYGEAFDETDIAKDLSKIKGFNHNKKVINGDECLSVVRKIQYHMDEPQANLSSIPLYFLVHMAKENMDVVFSGEGADELFGGYDLYGDTPKMAMYKKLPFKFRRAIREKVKDKPQTRLNAFLNRGGAYLYEDFIGEAKVYTPKEANEILRDEYNVGPSAYDIAKDFYEKNSSEPEITKQQLMDINYWMPGDIFQKADKMAAIVDLDVRMPFLDLDVMEVASKIPEEYRVYKNHHKYALREASTNVLPDEWAFRNKKGMPVPIRHWLKDEGCYEEFKEVLTNDVAKEFFNTDILKTMLDDHYSGSDSYQRHLWTVYVFLIWYDIYFIKEDYLMEQ
ncbi:MAG: asparagine synthase (glutamine-hydrolyzing) [Tissierellia bacterium]|nr:asparagine synthase (glutamine-hydrolyzing) [Tissierellia bacterium]